MVRTGGNDIKEIKLQNDITLKYGQSKIVFRSVWIAKS